MAKTKRRLASSVAISLLLAVAAGPASTHPPDHDHVHHEQTASGTEHGSLAEIGKKLSNPVSNVWALFTEFDFTLNNGNLNQGDDKFSSAMNFQPILPVPLSENWKMIIRPSVPVIWSAPRPDGDDTFNHDTGLGDIVLPLLVTPKLDNWLVGLGPTFTIPTSTEDAFGRQQWAMGPTGILGYKTEKGIVGVFPQYYWRLGSRGDQGDAANASYMNLLYFWWWNLPNAWQIGSNPNITYDHKAESGNKWNVPFGLSVTKTTKVAGRPVKFQFGAEYSIVSQDDFGKRMLFKINIIPVIPSLIKNPIFGGGS